MRVAMCSDQHLGHRRYNAMADDGRRQREADVSAAWFAAVDAITAAKPDLILLGGDLFDSPRPGNLAIRDGVEGCLRLQKVAPVLSVIGNHDRQKAEEGGVGSPQDVLAKVGVKVVTGAEYVRIPSLNTTVLCVAERHIRRVKLVPNKDNGLQLLLAHGAVGGSLAAVADVLPADAISPLFTAAFFGDYHVAQQIAANAWYPGSLEYVSSNVWAELATPKGWLLWEDGQVSQQAVPVRQHIDLERFSAEGMTAEDVTARMVAGLQSTAIDGAVVRQVVVDCHRVTRSALNHKALKAASKSALHYHQDVRLPAHENKVRAMLFEGEDDTAPPDGFANWEQYEAWLSDSEEPAASAAEYSYADDLMAGTIPLLDVELDPYNLNSPARAKSAA